VNREFGKKWSGSVVAVLGGGPGLSPGQVQKAREAGALIVAINKAIDMVPDADMLYFCDSNFFEGHRDSVMRYSRAGFGPIVTLENWSLQKEIPGLINLINGGMAGLSKTPGAVKTGKNSGFQVLNLLVQLEAKRALLLGFDQRPVDGKIHWFGNYKVPTPPEAFPPCIEQFRAAREDFSTSCLQVINCTAGSALDAFRMMPLGKALALK